MPNIRIFMIQTRFKPRKQITFMVAVQTHWAGDEIWSSSHTHATIIESWWWLCKAHGIFSLLVSLWHWCLFTCACCISQRKGKSIASDHHNLSRVAHTISLASHKGEFALALIEKDDILCRRCRGERLRVRQVSACVCVQREPCHSESPLGQSPAHGYCSQVEDCAPLTVGKADGGPRSLPQCCCSAGAVVALHAGCYWHSEAYARSSGRQHGGVCTAIKLGWMQAHTKSTHAWKVAAVRVSSRTDRETCRAESFSSESCTCGCVSHDVLSPLVQSPAHGCGSSWLV